jgi:hypothetical protein
VNEDELINNNILVFSSNIYTFQEIKNLVIRIKPSIIVHLSDEWGNKPEYTHLASYTKLLLHQYHFNHYPYNEYNNIIQIPLGYMIGMFNGEKAFNHKIKRDLVPFCISSGNAKPISEKKYIWSFIGNTQKQDRKELIYKFTKKFSKKELTNKNRLKNTENSDNYFVGNNIQPVEMLDIYNNSMFVPNGKGNVVIDCFRIYEAILAGSIPIIVCDEKEFNERFYYNNDIPPFIHEKTWDEAVDKCEYLSKNIKELENISHKNYEWLQNKFKSIQEVIIKQSQRDCSDLP